MSIYKREFVLFLVVLHLFNGTEPVGNYTKYNGEHFLYRTWSTKLVIVHKNLLLLFNFIIT